MYYYKLEVCWGELINVHIGNYSVRTHHIWHHFMHNLHVYIVGSEQSVRSNMAITSQ